MRAFLKCFVGDRRGNVAMLFGLALLPILGLAGAAIDYSRAGDAHARLQAAVDSASLTLAKMPLTASQTDLEQRANTIIRAFLSPAVRDTLNLTLTRTNGSIAIAANAQVSTPFMSLVGPPAAPLQVTSTVNWGNTRLRVALALDVTGSMNSSNKLTAMKTATSNLLDQLQGAAKSNGDVYVSIVPFAKDVNAGSSNSSQSWVKWSGSYDTWDENNGSCSNGVTNYAAGSPSNPTSRKAACEAQSKCSNTSYTTQSTCTGNGTCSKAGYNTQSSCTATGACSYSSYTDQSTCQSNGKCVVGSNTYQPYSTSYKATCQQYGGTWTTYAWTPSTWTPHTWNAVTWTPASHSTWNGCMMDRDQSYDTTNTAPGATSATLFPAEQYDSCPAQLMALSYDWTTLKAKVSSLAANGGTNQQIGMAWAYQTLTASPFSIPAMDPNYTYNQAIILLSDGLNTQNRLYGDGQNPAPQVDDRQRILCDSVKGAGIKVYTVQVNTTGDPTSSVLQYCASPGKFSMLTSSDQIVSTFQQIGTELSDLRVTH